MRGGQLDPSLLLVWDCMATCYAMAQFWRLGRWPLPVCLHGSSGFCRAVRCFQRGSPASCCGQLGLAQQSSVVSLINIAGFGKPGRLLRRRAMNHSLRVRFLCLFLTLTHAGGAGGVFGNHHRLTLLIRPVLRAAGAFAAAAAAAAGPDTSRCRGLPGSSAALRACGCALRVAAGAAAAGRRTGPSCGRGGLALRLRTSDARAAWFAACGAKACGTYCTLQHTTRPWRASVPCPLSERAALRHRHARHAGGW